MKKFFLCALVIGWAATAVQAQSNRKKTTVHKTTISNRTALRAPHANTTPPPIVTAVSSGSYAAHSPAPAAGGLSIADPTINALNARANGSDVSVGKSGIVGMPKRAYGFANGRLLLNTTTATSSGTITGSGSVGTGSSLGSIGGNGSAIGLNGKSPYSGLTMWGNAQNMTLRYGDRNVRLATGKKE